MKLLVLIIENPFQAASLGIADTSTEQSWGGSYRGYRGRGRGRSYFRGATAMRGGPPRASMKLDNRPKKLLVKGVREEGLQALRDWYEVSSSLVNNQMVQMLMNSRPQAKWKPPSKLMVVM